MCIKMQLNSLTPIFWKMSLPNSSSSKASWMSRRYMSGSLSLSDSVDSADSADSADSVESAESAESAELSVSTDRDD